MIRSKTAKLFEAAAELGALIAGASDAQIAAAGEYGRSLGTAFQLIDDVLDYAGDAAEIGKNVGDDLREGKPTLPLIWLMENGTPEQRELVRSCIEQGDEAAFRRHPGRRHQQRRARLHARAGGNGRASAPPKPSPACPTASTSNQPAATVHASPLTATTKRFYITTIPGCLYVHPEPSGCSLAR